MANRIAGVKDNLMKAATEEFLNKGFQNASLRHIAEEAGTSTNSIYVRFKDKEGMFHEIVQPVAEEFLKLYAGEMETFENNTPDMPYEEMFDYASGRVEVMLDYVYEHYDSFKLLICCAEGTEYTDFIHKLAEVESESTLHYMKHIKSNAFSSGKISLQLLHMLSSAYLSGLFEIVKHDMDRVQAGEYVGQLRKFFSAGWRDIFEPQK